MLEDLIDDLRRTAERMAIPVSSTEVEFGPSQIEFVFEPDRALVHADTMLRFRSMAKQVCQCCGLHASFMCRLRVAQATASGWHVHQLVIDLHSGENVFAAKQPAGELRLSPHNGLPV